MGDKKCQAGFAFQKGRQDRKEYRDLDADYPEEIPRKFLIQRVEPSVKLLIKGKTIISRKYSQDKFDELVKSRHSGLSGIMLPQNALKKYDSGQAGMTD